MLYKLVNGTLQTPPTVWNGIVGYDKDEARQFKDGWKPLLETGSGTAFKYIEYTNHIEKRWYEPMDDYRAARRKAYPELGDVIDALLKAYQGNSTELDAIIKQREAVKKSIKKK